MAHATMQQSVLASSVQPGDVVIGLNQCKIGDKASWETCLDDMYARFNAIKAANDGHQAN